MRAMRSTRSASCAASVALITRPTLIERRVHRPTGKRISVPVMDIERFRSLLKDAAIAADPRSGGLLDYRDLQQMLAKVAAEASSLLEECNARDIRLTRKPVRPPDQSLPYGHATDQAASVDHWLHH